MTPQSYERRSPWLRGLHMLILAILFAVAETVLFVCTLVQFGWLVVTRTRNPHIASFGEQLARWLAKTALFQTGASEDKPFPWSDWK